MLVVVDNEITIVNVRSTSYTRGRQSRRWLPTSGRAEQSQGGGGGGGGGGQGHAKY